MSIANKIAVVSGASRGIGKAIALELGKRGVTVIGTATSEAGATQISAYLQEAGIKGRGLVLDAGSAASVEAFAKLVQDQFGTVEILVNNAGITRDNLMLRMKEDEWDAVINTNLTSVFRLTRSFLRGMTKSRWGRIISISSVVGSSGNAGGCRGVAGRARLERPQQSGRLPRIYRHSAHPPRLPTRPPSPCPSLALTTWSPSVQRLC